MAALRIRAMLTVTMASLLLVACQASPVGQSAPSGAPPATSASPGCPPPWNICTTTSATGTFDGAGVNEVFGASPVWSADGSAIRDWLLGISLPGKGITASAYLSALTAAHGPCPALPTDYVGYAAVRGAADFTGTGRELALVEVSHGASTKSAILVGVVNGSLALATVANGAQRCQRIFYFGGSVTHGNGLGCGQGSAGRVLLERQVSVQSSSSSAYNWSQATYTWQGLQLNQTSQQTAVIPISDPRYQLSYSVVCSPINIPD
jgi:hypothetical protein